MLLYRTYARILSITSIYTLIARVMHFQDFVLGDSVSDQKRINALG